MKDKDFKPYISADQSPKEFTSYFTTNRPTIIMVEWKLDHGAGYFLTGMMVRKNQDFMKERNM